MGLVSRQLDDDDADPELLQELIDDGHLEEKSAAYGIALNVIDNGTFMLSEKQQAVYDKVIWPLLADLAEKRDCRQRADRARDC